MVETTNRGYAELAGRILLSAIFLFAGFGKVMDWSGTAQQMTDKGMVAVPLFLASAIAFELGFGTALLTGCWTRTASFALILFLIPTTLIFHNFWDYAGAERQMQMINFLKNLAIMGGLTKFAVEGAGAISFDARNAKPEVTEPTAQPARILAG